MYVCKTAKNGNFYPRSPCGERPCPRCSRGTLPKDFYPRSPCGERRKYMRCVLPVLISIHALLAESDATWYTSAPWMAFLSTLSLRRATRQPRAQADRPPPFLSTLSLRRATGLSRYVAIIRQIFLSTLSLRRATAILAPLHNPDIVFLSTLSLRRATARAPHYLDTLVNFYPRSPCGERPRRNANYNYHSISIHALLAESDSIRSGY